MTRNAPSLLLIDDDDTFRETLARELLRDFAALRAAAGAAEGLSLIEAEEPDVLLLDLNLGKDDGLEVLERVRERHPSVEVIIVTAFGTVDAAVEAMRKGAFDFVTKPLQLEALVSIVLRAAERRELRRTNVGLRRMLHRDRGEFVGISAQIDEVRRAVRHAAESEVPVLVSGPSGCGKELVARAIHRASPRGGRDLIAVNCASLQGNLLESELFGHERGAFTGADAQRPGLFEAAHGTTLFLDEIGELPLALQAKLLRAIQFGEIRRVGGVSSLKVDARIIAATNRDLAEDVAAKAFREDLYYRLNVLAIRIPPLRDRPDDVEPLVRHVAARAGLDYELGDEHYEVLRRYPWPGNVREIENLVQRLKLRENEGPPDPALLLALLEPRAAARPTVRPLFEVEEEAIRHALRHFDGDRKATARALGISVRTLYYRLANYRDASE